MKIRDFEIFPSIRLRIKSEDLREGGGGGLALLILSFKTGEISKSHISGVSFFIRCPKVVKSRSPVFPGGGGGGGGGIVC